MIQYGYTNGEKSSSALDWVAIAKRKKNNMDRSPQDMAELMHSHCSVHNLMWNMYLRKAPPEIMDKFKHDTQKMLKMDWNMGGDPLGQDPVISLKLDDGWYELSKGIELGPPGGAFANYYSKQAFSFTESDFITINMSTGILILNRTSSVSLGRYRWLLRTTSTRRRRSGETSISGNTASKF